MIIFVLGFFWFFLISMQTRIVACADNLFLNAGWTFLVSIVWVFLMKQITLNDSSIDLILYAFGTAIGSVFATYVHSKLKKQKL